MTPRHIEYWVIPPECDGEFAAKMEDVLDLYAEASDPNRPVVCMDEQPKQLIRETRTPIPPTVGHPKRVDYEYERAGTANIFMFTDPLAGWRQATVRQTKTKLDWAHEVAAILEGPYRSCDKVRLVCDNLNTHIVGSLYEAFAPERARRLASRLEIHYTPKHGSWLNIAECELSAMTRQCLNGRRIGDINELRNKVAAWSADINARQRGVNWQMTTKDARIKLKSVYPKIEI
jgi:hypothetical protein